MYLNKNYRTLKLMGFFLSSEKGAGGWRYLRLSRPFEHQAAGFTGYRNSIGDDGSEESFEMCLPGSHQDQVMKKVLGQVYSDYMGMAA